MDSGIAALKRKVPLDSERRCFKAPEIINEHRDFKLNYSPIKTQLDAISSGYETYESYTSAGHLTTSKNNR